MFIVVVLIVLIVVLVMVDNKGYVLIFMGNLVVEISVVVFGIMLLGVIVIWMLVSMLFGRVICFICFLGSWFGGCVECKK